MASYTNANSSTNQGFRGLSSIFEYTNYDGIRIGNNCGQAAATTMMTYRGRFSTSAGAANMVAVEGAYPPDILGGALGTSSLRMGDMIKGFNRTYLMIDGESQLKENLRNSKPVILLMEVPGASSPFGGTLPGGHWVAAYGYDVSYVYLTNYGRRSWNGFLTAWNSMVICGPLAMMKCGFVVF